MDSVKPLDDLAVLIAAAKNKALDSYSDAQMKEFMLFKAEVGLYPGTIEIEQYELYKVYLLWTKTPMPKKNFICLLDYFFRNRKTNKRKLILMRQKSWTKIKKIRDAAQKQNTRD